MEVSEYVVMLRAGKIVAPSGHALRLHLGDFRSGKVANHPETVELCEASFAQVRELRSD